MFTVPRHSWNSLRYIGWEFEFSDVFHERVGADKMGVGGGSGSLCKKKEGGTLSLIFKLTNPFQSYFSLRDWCCVLCCLFFVLHGKNLVLLNLIKRYVTSTSE